MVLSREDFIKSVTNMMNGDVGFLENMTDTFDSLDSSSRVAELETENKLLKEAYIQRFSAPHKEEDRPEETPGEKEEEETELTFDSLFK